MARRLASSLIGRCASSGAALDGSNIALSSAEHCAASRALAASASAAFFLSAAGFVARLGRGLAVDLGLARGLGLVPAEHEVDVVVDAAVIIDRLAVIDQHQPVGGQFDHVAVMADEDHRAVIAVERLDQRLAAVDVEMVGRLVEDQQMRRVARDQRQRQPRALAARQFVDPGHRPVARETEPPELGADRARGRALHLAAHVLQRRVVAVQFLDLILGEVTDLHLARGVHLAGHRRELRGEQARQRGLAVAVAAEQRDPVVGIDPQVELLEDDGLAIADRGEVERDQRRAQFARVGEVEAQAGIVGERGDRLHLGEHLGARLRLLGGRGAGRVAGDIILQPGALGVLRLAAAAASCAARSARWRSKLS